MPVIKFPDGGARVSIFLQSIGNAFRKHLFGDKGANLLGEKATEQVLKRSEGFLREESGAGEEHFLHF